MAQWESPSFKEELSQEQVHNRARRLAIEDALVELAGPAGKNLACKESSFCGQYGSLQFPESRGLTRNFNLMKEIDLAGPRSEQELANDLDVINRNLKSHEFPFEIIDVDRQSNVVLKDRNSSDRFELKREPGLLTIAEAGPNKSGKAEAPEPNGHALDGKGQAGEANVQALDRKAQEAEANVQALDGKAQALPGEIPSKLRLDKSEAKPEHVTQANIQTCYFLASLAALANTKKYNPFDMITENKDGTFSVKFPGEKDAITIERPNAAELKFFSEQDQLNWSHVLEKAHRKLTQQSLFDPGGSQAEAIKLLTGKDYAHIHMKGDMEKYGFEATKLRAEKVVQTALQRQEPIVVGSRDVEAEKQEGIQQRHSYTIMNYDAQRKVVTVRNQAGDHTEKFPRVAKGTYEVPLDAFVKVFNEVSTTVDGFPKLDEFKPIVKPENAENEVNAR